MHEYERLVRGAFDLLEAGDLEGYVACLTDDVVGTNPFGVFRGKAEVLAYNHQTLRETLAAHFRRVEHLVVSGENVAVWLTFGGTVAATGRSFEVEGCVIFDVRDGKVCAVTEYVDFTEAQVGPDMHPHEQLVRDALERLNVALDIEGYIDCLSDDVVHTHQQGIDRGKVEVLASHSAFALLSHRHAQIERLLVSGDSVAVWSTSAGTVAATGGSFEIEVCTIFDIRDNKICAIHEYADLTPVVAAFAARA